MGQAGREKRSRWRQTAEGGRAGLTLPVPGQANQPNRLSLSFPAALPMGTALAQTRRARARLRGRAGILLAREVAGFHLLLRPRRSPWRRISRLRYQGSAHCPGRSAAGPGPLLPVVTGPRVVAKDPTRLSKEQDGYTGRQWLWRVKKSTHQNQKSLSLPGKQESLGKGDL